MGWCDTESWIDIQRDEFWLDPGRQLPRLYRCYQGAVSPGICAAQLEQEE